jgi:hypothetical protein
LEELVQSGLLEEVRDLNGEVIAHRLSKLAIPYADAATRFREIWSARESDRLWLAALIGDWELAADLAQKRDDRELIDITHERALESNSQRVALIRESIGDGPACTLDLHALHALGTESLDEYVRRGLATDGWGFGAVAHFLKDIDDSTWCPFAFEFLQRNVPSRSGGYQRELFGYLVRCGYRRAESLKLLAVEYDSPGEAARMALQHSPDIARPFVRKAFRLGEHTDGDDSSKTVQRVAAALVHSKVPWASEESLEALQALESDALANRYDALPLVLALAEFGSDDDSRIVTSSWCQLFDDVELSQCSEDFQRDVAASKRQCG